LFGPQRNDGRIPKLLDELLARVRMMPLMDTSGSVHERIDGHTFAEERLLLDVNEQLRQHFPDHRCRRRRTFLVAHTNR
jgi:hypothetical protein